MAEKKRRRQHSKGNKSNRPRAWHHGAAQGAKDEKKLIRATPAFERAAADQAELAERTREHRESTSDWNACLTQLDRAAPFVPRIEAAW